VRERINTICVQRNPKGLLLTAWGLGDIAPHTPFAATRLSLALRRAPRNAGQSAGSASARPHALARGPWRSRRSVRGIIPVFLNY